METCADGSKVFRNQKQEELYSCQNIKFIDHDTENSTANLPTRRNVAESLKIRVIDSKNKNNSQKPPSCKN